MTYVKKIIELLIPHGERVFVHAPYKHDVPFSCDFYAMAVGEPRWREPKPLVPGYALRVGEILPVPHPKKEGYAFHPFTLGYEEGDNPFLLSLIEDSGESFCKAITQAIASKPRPVECVGWQSPSGGCVFVSSHQEDLLREAGTWLKDETGEEYCSPVWGGRMMLPTFTDKQITKIITIGGGFTEAASVCSQTVMKMTQYITGWNQFSKVVNDSHPDIAFKTREYEFVFEAISQDRRIAITYKKIPLLSGKQWTYTFDRVTRQGNSLEMAREEVHSLKSA